MTVPRFVSVADAALLLSVHPATIRRQIASGGLPARRMGREWRIPLDAVIDTPPPRSNSTDRVRKRDGRP